jgi:hypothetical protein
MKTGGALAAKKTGARIIAEIAQALTKNTPNGFMRTTMKHKAIA